MLVEIMDGKENAEQLEERLDDLNMKSLLSQSGVRGFDILSQSWAIRKKHVKNS